MKSACWWPLIFAASLPVHAGMPNASCSAPVVFPDARVNVIVLPYSNPSVHDADLERAGSQLTLLLQQTILFSALKYPSIGTVRMLPASPGQTADCASLTVARKILGQAPGAMQKLRPDGAAILLWGQLYKEGNQIYLCSYARLVKNSKNLSMESSGGGHGIYYADLPSDAVAFPARAITTGLLSQIGSSFQRAARVHRDRNLDSPGNPLPADPRTPISYQVLEATADGWMRVRSMNGEVSGWIYANEAMRSQELARNLPELRFVDGAIGYLDWAKAPNPAAVFNSARPSLEAFAEMGTRDTTLAAATAKSMLAIMYARDAPGQGRRGYQLAREAVALVPYNADARNLELVYRLELTSSDVFRPAAWRAFADELTQAAALGPDKPYILDNLDRFYAGVLAVKGLADASAASEIRRRREQIATLRSAAIAAPNRPR